MFQLFCLKLPGWNISKCWRKLKDRTASHEKLAFHMENTVSWKCADKS